MSEQSMPQTGAADRISYTNLGQLAPDQKLPAMLALQDDPHAAPGVLHNMAWQALGDAFYARKLDDPGMFPAAHRMFKRVAENESVRAAQDKLFFDSRIVLSTWNIFRSRLTGIELGQRDRNIVMRNIGRLARDIAGPVGYDITKLDSLAVQKLTETLTIGTLLMSKDPSVTAVPSMPYAHHIKGIDETLGTSAFHAYLMNDELTVPVYTRKNVTRHMYNSAERRGTFQMGLGNMLMGTAMRSPSILQEARQATDSTSRTQDWLVGYVADSFAAYADSNRTLENRQYTLLYSTGKHIAHLALQYDPEGTNAPPRHKIRPNAHRHDSHPTTNEPPRSS